MPWDPSVQSLVAFPQTLAMELGEKPRVGAQPGRRLPRPARAGDGLGAAPAREGVGGGKPEVTTSHQVVAFEPAPPPPQVIVVNAPPPPTQIITIVPARPQVVFVPVFHPRWVFGPWWHPAFPPFFFPPPVRWGWGGPRWGTSVHVGFWWGRPIPVTHSLWGRGPLGPAQREHQRQPLEHHPRQSPDQLARRQRGLAPRPSQSPGRAVPWGGDAQPVPAAARRPADAKATAAGRAREPPRPDGPGGAARAASTEPAPQRPGGAGGGAVAPRSARDRAAGVDRSQIQHRRPRRPGAGAEPDCRGQPRQRAAGRGQRRPDAPADRPWRGEPGGDPAARSGGGARPGAEA